MITIKTKEEIEIISQNGKIVAETLDLLCKSAKPGVSTLELNDIADTFIRDHGAVPSCFGYKGYPKSICVSINEEIVHGMPSERKLEEGQIVTFDVCLNKNGFHADAATTIPIGNVSEKALQLINVCNESFYEGIKKANVGNRITDITFAIYSYVKSRGFSVIKNYGGHGIGRELHESPFVPNYYCKCKELGTDIQEGMVFTVEPMICVGKRQIKVLDNKWTVVTVDSSLAAHCEHTVAIIDGKAKILTNLEDV